MDDIMDVQFMKINELRVGDIHSFYGVIVAMEGEKNLSLSIGNNLRMTAIVEPNNMEIIRQRMFDPGIFICKIKEICNGIVYGHCQTVVFGKQPLVQ